MSRFILLLFGCMLMFAAPGRAQDAAFGLAWGDTAEAAVAKGLAIGERKAGPTGEIINSRKLPMTPADTDDAALVFHRQHGLQKIVWHSGTITNDPTGATGQRTFAALAKILGEKYGTPSITEAKAAAEPDQFYQCLYKEGCGRWLTVWQLAEGGCVAITIKSFGNKGEGWVQVSYEGPRWLDIVRAVQADRSSKAF